MTLSINEETSETLQPVGRRTQRTLFIIRSIEMNVQVEAKLVSSAVGEENQSKLYQTRQNVYFYKPESFCIAMSYLQFTEL